MLAGSELLTVGPAMENARRANSVRTRGKDSSGAPAERSGLSGATKNAGLELNGQKRKGGN